jgi:hypothetical protein
LAQHDDGGKATQPVEQGASDAGLAPVETLAQGGMSAAARARALQLLAHRVS